MDKLKEYIDREQPQLVIFTGYALIIARQFSWEFRSRFDESSSLLDLSAEVQGVENVVLDIELSVVNRIKKGDRVYVSCASNLVYRELYITCIEEGIKSVWYSKVDGVEKIGSSDDIDIPQLDFELLQSERYMDAVSKE